MLTIFNQLYSFSLFFFIKKKSAVKTTFLAISDLELFHLPMVYNIDPINLLFIKKPTHDFYKKNITVKFPSIFI
jgi:hypothetical protein